MLNTAPEPSRLAEAEERQRQESQLIARILAGESQLFHELIRPYERSVYMIVLSMVKDAADAEDAAQEAFLRAYTKLAGFRAEAKFSTWLISIAVNEARSRLRRRKTERTESLDDDSDDHATVSPAVLTDWREVPSQLVERHEVRAILQQAVAALPPIYREVFVLRDVDELSVNETAEALAISVPSVKVRLHRARLMLQRELAPQLQGMVKPEKRRFLWF
ncbi:MAG: sigma-70 family RNA polymerase sigma factor [Acidobacteriota bacterium]|nr:sigma-70 family RNA polymerase sigma factor [Acidobacteriota bacterium]